MGSMNRFHPILTTWHFREKWFPIRGVIEPEYQFGEEIALESYLRELEISGITYKFAIWLLVASVSYQLWIPYSKIVFTVCSRRENCDRRSEMKKRKNMENIRRLRKVDLKIQIVK